MSSMRTSAYNAGAAAVNSGAGNPYCPERSPGLHRAWQQGLEFAKQRRAEATCGRAVTLQ